MTASLTQTEVDTAAMRYCGIPHLKPDNRLYDPKTGLYTAHGIGLFPVYARFYRARETLDGVEIDYILNRDFALRFTVKGERVISAKDISLYYNNYGDIRGSRLKIKGNVTRLDKLWDIAPDYNSAHLDYAGLNGYIYNFYTEGAALKANRLDPRTLEQKEGVLVHDFHEKITGIQYLSDGIIVKTKNAAYLLDEKLKVRKRRAWPEAMPKHAEEIILNNDLSMAAFYSYDPDKGIYGDDGTYLCKMREDATPVLLQKGVPFDDKDVGLVQSPYPVRFLDNDRLFIAVSVWEAIGEYRVVDFSGKVLDKIPCHVSREHSGGYSYDSPSGALFLEATEVWNYYNYEKDWAKPVYYDFELQKLERVKHFMNLGGFSENGFISDPKNPDVWYISRRDSFEGQRRTTFYKADFKTKKAKKLPVSVFDADAKLIAISDTGDLLFFYSILIKVALVYLLILKTNRIIY